MERESGGLGVGFEAEESGRGGVGVGEEEDEEGGDGEEKEGNGGDFEEREGGDMLGESEVVLVRRGEVVGEFVFFGCGVVLLDQH